MRTKRDLQPIILIRNVEEKHSWLEYWRSKGLPYVRSPVLQIIPQKILNVDQILHNNNFFIFTSNHAVQIFLDQLVEEGQKKDFQSKPKICVGIFTADLLLRGGYSSVYIPPQGESAMDIARVFENGEVSVEGRGVFLCGNSASSLLEKKLSTMGISVFRKELYDVVPLETFPVESILNLQSEEYSYILFCSGLSVRIFAKKFREIVDMGKLRILCIGNTSRVVLDELKIKGYSYIGVQDNIAKKVLEKVYELG